MTHHRGRGRPPSATGRKHPIVTNRHSKFNHPKTEIDPVSGDPVVTVRNVGEVVREILAEHRQGISPPRIAVRLQVPLGRVLATLKASGFDVSAYDLSGVEAYGFGGAS